MPGVHGKSGAILRLRLVEVAIGSVDCRPQVGHGVEVAGLELDIALKQWNGTSVKFVLQTDERGGPKRFRIIRFDFKSSLISGQRPVVVALGEVGIAQGVLCQAESWVAADRAGQARYRLVHALEAILG